MKTALIYLWIITYPACGEAIYDLLQGPFLSPSVCEAQLAQLTADKGPPTPGSIYSCREKP